VAAPLPASQEPPPSLFEVPPELNRPVPAPGKPRFALLASASGAIDLAAELGPLPAQGASVLVGGVLELDAPLRGYLLVGADGAVVVNVGGKALYERHAEVLRSGAWDTVPLDLAAGEHPILIWLRRQGTPFSFELRLLDRDTLSPPRNVSVRLPGTTDPEMRFLARKLPSMVADIGLGGDGYHPVVRVQHARGALRGLPLDVAVSVRLRRAATPLHEAFDSVSVGPSGAQELSIRLPALSKDALPVDPTELEILARIGEARLAASASVSRSAPELFDRATGLAARLPERTWVDINVLRTTLQLRQKELAAATNGPRLGTLAEQMTAMRELLRELEAGHDPLTKPGIWDLAWPSVVDGQPDGFRLHVPLGAPDADAQALPLVLLLHGYNGTPRSVMSAFLDSSGARAHPKVGGYVLAPEAHGNGFYRGAAERQVMRLLELARRRLKIDPDRVSITGVSMGGTGAASLGLRHADVFAAVAPLCGYHSFFLRRDMRGRAVRAWELPLLEHWSNASFAESGRNLPLHVAHGLRDLPLENSRVLVDRYRALGYSVAEDWPDMGHDVHKHTWARASLWPWLVSHERKQHPAEVAVRTNQLRYGKQHWLRLDAIEPGAFAEARATRTTPGEVRVTTENVLALKLDRGELGTGPMTLHLDADELRYAAGEPVAAHLVENGWHRGIPERKGLYKRSGLEGPIHDVLLEPLLVVYGAGHPGTARANREAAEVFMGRFEPTSRARFALHADSEMTDELAASHSLVLVGTAADHRLIRAFGASLPIRVDGDAIVAGSRRFTGREVGAVFIHPNPVQPHRYVVVLTAPDPAGLFRAGSLPWVLPDFLVYDGELAAGAGLKVLDRGNARTAGYFTNGWLLPE
jgi:predicted esterase